MSAIPTPTTEQEAVNTMLASIGERPVNDIHDSQRLDVLNARQALNQVNVSVQTRGWWFNTEIVDLTPNNDGEYELESDVVKVIPYYKADKVRYVQRGSVLFDRETNTTEDHTDTLRVSWVRLLPFDDMPETARNFIAQRAGVKFQKRTVGSPTLFEFTKEDEQEAWGYLQLEEAEQEAPNLTESPHLFDVVYQR